MYIDTHAHLDFDVYDEDCELVIQRALKNEVKAIITIGTDVKSSTLALGLAEKYVPVFAAVGIHPTDCAETNEADIDHIRELAQNDKVVAIGEVGLDYYHMRATAEKQMRVFEQQIDLARELNLPVIIHNRDAHDDMYQMIIDQNISDLGGVLHSFSGNEQFLNKIIETDLHISFTGNITFKRSKSDTLVRQAPIERLLLETDSPFLTPVPLRGKRNEPAYIVHTAEKIAGLKSLTLPEVGRITSENAMRLFKIDI